MKILKKKRFIVQANFDHVGGWGRSGNVGANGVYTLESAKRRAAHQEKKSATGLKYRIKEIK